VVPRLRRGHDDFKLPDGSLDEATYLRYKASAIKKTRERLGL
jgi:hypothetical protein